MFLSLLTIDDLYFSLYSCLFVLCKDTEQWEKLRNAIGDSCTLLSDITYKSQAPPLPGVRGHIIKHIYETTISDLVRMTSEHQGNRWSREEDAESVLVDQNSSLSDLSQFLTSVKMKALIICASVFTQTQQFPFICGGLMEQNQLYMECVSHSFKW